MPKGAWTAEEVISAGAVTIPLESTPILLPFTSSERRPALTMLSAAPEAIHWLNAFATNVLADAFGRIGLRSP